MNLQLAAPEEPTSGLAVASLIERAPGGLAVLTAFSIPLSTSLSEIAVALFMVCWILSGHFTAKWALIRQNRVALMSLGLFGLLLLGIAWSVAGPVAGAHCLLKYRELVYLPMFVVVFQDARLRTRAVSAYMVAAALILGLSYFEWLSGVDLGLEAHELDRSPVIFKDRIIHSLMMSLLVYLAAVRLSDLEATAAQDGPAQRRRWLYLALMGLSVFNILFMVEGRTGYLQLGGLTVLYLSRRLGRRGVVVGGLLLLTAYCTGLSLSHSVQRRMAQTISQIENQFGPERRHSLDARLEFYANTLKLVRRHPLLGTGTGSFEGQYARLVAGTDDSLTSDPHNEYLHLACQVGIGGPLLFLALLAVQWSSAGRLSRPEMDIGRAIVLIIALGSLFNSLILSVTGGLIYAFFSGLAFADLSQGGRAGASAAAIRPRVDQDDVDDRLRRAA
jgi:O-antigen ligase